MTSTITYLPTDEQQQLRDSLTSFFGEKSSQDAIRCAISSVEGYDATVWRQITDQLGLPSLAIPEEFGGSGFGYVESSVVAEVMGATLACTPYFATIALAANAVLCSDDTSAKADLLPLLAGGTTATLAISRTRDLSGIDVSKITGHRSGVQWRLNGSLPFVIDGASAEFVLVAAGTESGVSLFAVEAAQSGVRRSPMRTLDLTRRQAVVTFNDAPARLIGAQGSAAPGVTRALDLAVVALAAEQVGGAQHCLDKAVQYAKTREQFGRPIGTFQAIKHKCADTYLAIETARTAALHAAHVAAMGGDALELAAPLAKAVCSEAFTQAATENIHIHGGIGFTWEHEAHLYFRRAKASHTLLGTPAAHRELLVSRLGL